MTGEFSVEAPILAYVRSHLGNHTKQREAFFNWLDESLGLVADIKDAQDPALASLLSPELEAPFFYYTNDEASREFVSTLSKDLSATDIPKRERLENIVDGLLVNDSDITAEDEKEESLIEIIKHILLNQITLIKTGKVKGLETFQTKRREFRAHFKEFADFSSESSDFLKGLFEKQASAVADLARSVKLPVETAQATANMKEDSRTAEFELLMGVLVGRLTQQNLPAIETCLAWEENEEQTFSLINEVHDYLKDDAAVQEENREFLMSLCKIFAEAVQENFSSTCRQKYSKMIGYWEDIDDDTVEATPFKKETATKILDSLRDAST